MDRRSINTIQANILSDHLRIIITRVYFHIHNFTNYPQTYISSDNDYRTYNQWYI